MPDFNDVGSEVRETVEHATDVLEQELSRNLEEARELQRKFLDDNRVDGDQFATMTSRIRATTHEMITAASDQVGLRSEESQELLERFSKDAHEVVDLVGELLDSAPRLLNRFAEIIEDLDRKEREKLQTPDADPINR